MAEIQKIGNVFYRVPPSRLEEMVDFYERGLGLRLKFRDGTKWIAFDVGGVMLALSGVPDAPPASGGATVSLKVADIEGYRRQLQERGLQVGEIEAGEHERSLELEDPLGNTLVVYAPLAPA